MRYLKDLTAQCEMKANEWDQRSTMRAGELKALQEAIDIVGGSVAKTAGTRGSAEGERGGGRSWETADFYAAPRGIGQTLQGSFSADRSQILQVKMRLKAVAEIYTMHPFVQLCNLNFCCQKFAFFLKKIVCRIR